MCNDLTITYLNEYGDFRQVGPPRVLREAFKACRGSSCAVNGGEEGDGYPSAYDGQPHSGTHQRCVPACADRAGAERVDDGQEAVDADAGKEEHAAIDVGDERRSRYLAQSISKWPMSVHVVKDFKWQRENEH